MSVPRVGSYGWHPRPVPEKRSLSRIELQVYCVVFADLTNHGLCPTGPEIRERLKKHEKWDPYPVLGRLVAKGWLVKLRRAEHGYALAERIDQVARAAR